MEIISHSAEETFLIGKKIGENASPGLVIAFYGDLGAGKTVMTKGIARGLGIQGMITSPTFTILQIAEEGRLPPYLRSENFDTLRARAGRIRAVTAPLGAFLASDEGRAFDVGSFSDVPSFLSDTEHEALFAALARGGFRRFCVREFLARRGAPPAAHSSFSFDPELRASLEADDASLCYDFLVGERR